MCEILCIGHAAFDITYISDNFIKENSKYETETFNECGGGPAANAAYMLSSWGIKTAFAGASGNDYYGNLIVDDFRKAGTDISLLKQHDAKSPLSFIIINRNSGSRTVINRKDNKLRYHIDKDLLKKISPSVILTDGHEPEASLIALNTFPEAVSILDAGSLREGTKILLNKVNYAVVSEDFALSFSGSGNLESSRNRKKCLNFLHSKNKNTVVTLGEKGLIYIINNKIMHMKAFPAETTDTTGAGDIFHGAFAYGIYKNMPLEKNLRFSSAAASLSVEKTGGRTSIPSLDKVFKKALIFEQDLNIV